ncbi:MAG: cellulase family glycosylhydrolase [Ruminococcus sp.]|nr:cellulase family glycosylhydrolase [Ruminococcus sp.]
MRKFNGFMRGVNLGGWLSQGTYDKGHLDSFITEKDIKVIADWGLDHVRIPIDYNIFETAEGEPLEYGFEYLEKAYEWTRKYGLNMIIDLHKTFGYSFEKTYGEAGFFESEQLQERFYKLWERIAERFGGRHENVAFELLNEVNDPSLSDTWNGIIRQAIARVRALAPDTYILVGGYWNNSVDALHDLENPADDKIVYNFHCYDPFMFTHQAAYWVDNMPADYRIAYPGDINEYRRTVKEYGFTHIQDYLDVPDTGFTAEYFIGRFVNAAKLCEERGCPLYCGEYGVIEHASPEDTLNWYKDINTAFEKFGIGRSAWSYKQVDFGLSDGRLDSVLEELIKYL